MSDLRGKRIAAYGRMSTDKQNPTSAGDQVAKIRAHVEGRGGRLDPVLVFTDEAVSGQRRDRPGLSALMRAAELGEVDVLVVEAMDRISRDVAHEADFRKRLRFYGVRVIGISDGIDTDSRGAKMLAGMRAIMSDAFVDDVRDKTIRGMEAKARAGMSTGGLAYGYRTEPCATGHRIVIDEARAVVVRRIFAEYADGASLANIAAQLNAEGAPPPRGSRTKGTSSWRVTTLRAALRNERYTGRWTFGGREWVKTPEGDRREARVRGSGPLVAMEHAHLRIIDPQLWDLVQARLVHVAATFRQNKGGTERPRRREYLLSGLLVCGACGARMQIHGGNETRRYYGCSAAPRGVCTNKLSVLESLVRERFMAKLRDRLGDMIGEIVRSAQAAVRTWGATTDRERTALRARIGKAETATANLARAIAEGASVTTLAPMLREQESELAAARASLDALPAAPTATPPTLEEVSMAVLGLADLADDPREGREALRRLLDGDIRLEPHVNEQDPKRSHYVLRAGVLPAAILPATLLAGLGSGVSISDLRGRATTPIETISRLEIEIDLAA